VLGFEGISFWRYTEPFHDLELRLRQMDQAGVDRRARILHENAERFLGIHRGRL
jgi:hypothetical protein